MTILQPQFEGDWVAWYRQLGLHGNSVGRYKKIFATIKDAAGLEKMSMAAAERAYGIDKPKAANQPPLPKPSELPSDAQARDRISDGLALLLQLEKADAKVLQQMKDLANAVLGRIAVLEGEAAE